MPGQRRIVYILGAGASFGAGAYTTKQGGGRISIPTQSTFWDTFLRFCQNNQHRKTIEEFLYRYFLDYKKVPSRASEATRRRQLAPIDVEEVFTFLSERNYAPSVSPQLKAYTSRVWSALLEEIGQVFRHFTANRETRTAYRLFRKRHLRAHDTIVSFNYDIIFEQSLPRKQRWYYEGVHHKHEARALRILKPHGSINWSEHEGEIAATTVSGPFPRYPVVVAPTHLKFIGSGTHQEGRLLPLGYLNQSPQISNVWSAMEREMRDAKAWVFIGYSFPSSDLYFSSVLRSTLARRDSNPFVVIANPDGMVISQRIGNRFYIPQDRIKIFPDLETFNQINRVPRRHRRPAAPRRAGHPRALPTAASRKRP
jgi:hypothetical protein